MTGRARPAPESSTRRNLRLSTRDGGWYSVMWGLGEANITAFGVALGLSSVLVGLLDTVPKLLGSIIQTVSPRAVVRLGSLKRWIVLTASVQAFVLFPLAIGALLGGMPFALLLAVATMYWAASWACGNTWTTFISSLVPRQVRPAFFAQRNRWLNVVIVTATLLSGWLLAGGRSCGRELLTFAALFAVAGLARAISAMTLNRHTEREAMPQSHRSVSMRELIGRYRHGPGGRLLAYRLGVELAIQVSTPFMVPYFLQERGLRDDYTLFGVMIAVPILAKALALPVCGRYAKNHGARALLRLGGLAIVPVPLLWLADTSVAFMLLVQMITGVALAAYELSSLLMIFETVPEGERTSVLSKYNVAQFTATLVGSLIGAALLWRCGTAVRSPEGVSAGYAFVFLTSALLRGLTIALLRRVPVQTHGLKADDSD